MGHWKELSEHDITDRKRHLDKIVWGNRPFFSDNFFNAYQKLINSAFKTNNKWEEDALLRTKNIRPLDNSENDHRFTGEDSGNSVHDAYFDLLDVVAQELELKFERGEAPKPPESGADFKGNPG